MLIIPPPLLRTIIDAGEAAYPEEACGLLIGRGGRRRCRVTRVVPSPNLAADRRKGFEVDPGLRFRMMRELQDTDQRIIGHFHSHPDVPPLPSRHDLAMAFEPDFFWIITAVYGGQALATTVHRLDAGRGCSVNIPYLLECDE